MFTFKNTKSIHAQCIGFVEDVEITAIDTKFASVDLNFNSEQTPVQLHTIHPRNKSTIRRAARLVPASQFEHSIKRFRRDKSVLKDVREKSIPPPTTISEFKFDVQSPPAQICRTQMSFLDLPGEIRTNIYRHLFEEARVYICPASENSRYITFTLNVHLTLRATSKRIRVEADNMLYESLTLIIRPSVREIGTSILRLPMPVLDRIQYLVVASDRFFQLSFDQAQLNVLPSLRHVTHRFDDTYNGSHLHLRDFAKKKNEYLEDLITAWGDLATKRISILDNVNHHNDWFSNALRRVDRRFSMRLEHEVVMGSATTEKACDAQHVGQVLLLTASTDKIGPAQVAWLTAAEYKDRHECCLTIDERELDKSSTDDKPHNRYQLVKKRWKYMCYQEITERFKKVTEISGDNVASDCISSSD